MRPISDRLTRAISSGSGPPDLGSAGTPELFVYGTLAVNAVVEVLIDRVPESVEAIASGWRPAQLPDRPYPGLVSDLDGEASGRVYSDLSEREWAVLDAFEDSTYDVESVTLSTGRRALAYVWPAAQLPGHWTVGSLSESEMRTYLERCASWRSRYEHETTAASRSSFPN